MEKWRTKHSIIVISMLYNEPDNTNDSIFRAYKALSKLEELEVQ